MVGCRRLIGWDTERQRLVRDELDRKISALTAQLDENDARYAPGAEQARTRKRLEKIAREAIEVGGDEEGVAPLAQAPIPVLRATSNIQAKPKAKGRAKYCFAFRREQGCRDGDQCPYPHNTKESPGVLSLEDCYTHRDVMAVTWSQPQPREWTGSTPRSTQGRSLIHI